MQSIKADAADLILFQLNPVDSSLIAENFVRKLLKKGYHQKIFSPTIDEKIFDMTFKENFFLQ
jgi:hypothetical protein